MPFRRELENPSASWCIEGHPPEPTGGCDICAVQEEDYSRHIFCDCSSPRENSDLVFRQDCVFEKGSRLGHHRERVSKRFSRLRFVILRDRVIELSEPSISLVESDSVSVLVCLPMPIEGKLLCGS